MKKKRKCKDCKSEQVSNGEKKWYGWVWWCGKCYSNKFCREVESSPMALAKYYEIYGDKPSNILTPTSL